MSFDDYIFVFNRAENELISQNLLIFEAIISASMVTIMSGRESYIGEVLHISRTFEALIRIFLIVSSQDSFCPFLGSRWLAK